VITAAAQRAGSAIFFALALLCLPAPSTGKTISRTTGAQERAFLVAAEKTDELRVLSLQAERVKFEPMPASAARPGLPPPPPAPVLVPPDCERVRCAGNVEVLGEVKASAAQRAKVRKVLRGWLEGGPVQFSACMPLYHHAIAFSHDGHEYVALLCYSCGQYEIWVDGEPRSGGDLPGARGLRVLNAILAEGGVRGFEPSESRRVKKE